MAWSDFEWVIAVGNSEWNNTKENDQTLWTLCSTYNVSVLGIDLGIPPPKRSILDVPYRSGSISLTDDKDVRYESRRVSLRFESTGTLYNGYAAIAAFSAAFHGKTGFIYRKRSLPSYGYDPLFYGTMEVSKFDLNGSTFGFSINMEAFPYNIKSFTNPVTVSIYDTMAYPSTVYVSSTDDHLFIAVAFDPDYTTDGVLLRVNNDVSSTVTVPWGAGSSSLFNANMYAPTPVQDGANYKYIISVGPATALAPGVLNCKVTVRSMVCHL